MGLYSRAKMEVDLDHLDQLDQELSIRIADGRLSGLSSLRLAAKLDVRRRACRMKLVNAGQMVGDLRAAKSELMAATSESEMRLAKSHVDAAFSKIRWNSDGQPSQDAVECDSRPFAGDPSHEIALDSPEAQAVAIEAQRGGKRVVWRPGGKNVAIVYG